LIPATDGFMKEFKADINNRGKETPKWEVLKDADGNDMTKNVDLDLIITIGAGLPSNKAFLWQMFQQLSTLVVENQSVIHYEEFRYILKEMFGLPLMEADEIVKQQQAEQQAMAAAGGAITNPSSLGNVANGNPNTIESPQTGGGAIGNNK